MGKISKEIRRQFDATREYPYYLCNAPFCSMSFSLDGMVSPCCRNTSWHDNYPQRSISQIWKGETFNRYRKAIKSNIMPDSCACCESRLNKREFFQPTVHQYDMFKVKRIGKKKVQSIQLTPSIKCNLKCIMCNEMFSSQYEKIDTYDYGQVYDNNFYEELFSFIPDLKEIICIGGETFLIDEYYTIWNKILELNPSCKISVATNGTILNEKIIDLIERGNFSINFSLDSLKKEVYESIRRNANFETVMHNMKIFGDMMHSQNKTMQVMACAMKQNKYEIPDLLRFCNENGYHFIVLTIFRAMDVALWDLPSEELKELKQFYSLQKFGDIPENLKTNISCYNDFIANMDVWIDAAQRKENFTNIFDLKNNLVPDLKRKLFDDMDKCMKYVSLTESEYKRKKDFIFTKFNKILEEMPDFFNSNHFYLLLSKTSPDIIIEHLTLCNSNTFKKIIEECFYYCGMAH